MYATNYLPAARNVLSSSYEQLKLNPQRNLPLHKKCMGKTWFYQRLVNKAIYPQILVEGVNEFSRAKEEED